MSEVQSPNSEVAEAQNLQRGEDLSIVDGEILEVADGEEFVAKIESRKTQTANRNSKIEIENKEQTARSEGRIQTTYAQYIFLPAIFLVVALLGGLRLDARDASFLFIKPELVCLIYASGVLFLFFRARLLKLEGWFSPRFPAAKTAANAGALLTLFFASAQIFNSLLPERGLPFLIIAFCFFWTLWNNMFAEFDARRLIKSLAGTFALAFFVKYLVLANLAAPPSESLWQRIAENPTKEAFTYLLDLPRFAAATGYVQFFALALYLLGLFLLQPETRSYATNAETGAK